MPKFRDSGNESDAITGFKFSVIARKLIYYLAPQLEEAHTTVCWVKPPRSRLAYCHMEF